MGVSGTHSQRCRGQDKPGRRPGLVVRSRSRGFTLTELIVTIVVVGIMAAMVLPRFRGESGFEDRALRDETAAALRHAQKSAIAARRQVCLDFQANGLTATIATNFGGACDTPLPAPGGGALAVVARGASLYAAHPGATLSFDPMGRPVNGQAQVSVQGLPAGLTITVEAETGYVH